MSRPGSSLLVAALVALLVAPAAGAAEEQPVPLGAPRTPPTVLSPDRVIVEWARGASRAERTEAREDADVDFSRDLGDRRFQLVETEPGQSPRQAVRELESDPAVLLAERDGYSAPNAIPDDPLFSQLWGLFNTGAGVGGFAGAVAGADIDASAAWDLTVGTPTTVVADIDSGYRGEHPDLQNVAWANPGETDDGIDNDGNGVIDDLDGADFVGANAEDPETDGDPTDDDLLTGGHGVHTAGTIGAEGDNEIGITGVAQDVRIMPLRACSHFPALGESRCPFSAQVEAINYAGDKEARVANMSLGGTFDDGLVGSAIGANPETLFVISAGNDGQDNDLVPHYPCNYQPPLEGTGAVDNVICVAATDQADQLAAFSDWGATSVDLAAPGTETLSTYPIRRPVADDFEADDFEVRWVPSGSEGGFSRSNEPPLTSFGMTDSPGDVPAAGSTRASTTVPVTLPSGLQECVLEQTRSVSLGGGSYRYVVTLDGAFVAGSTPGDSSRRRFSLDLSDKLSAGGDVEVRFRYTAGPAPLADSGVWIDDVELRCTEPVGQASGYAFLQGTSMAAPHVSGAAALLFSMRPTATVTEVRKALLDSVDPIPSLAGKTTTGGRLDAGAAAALLDGVAPSAPSLAATDPASPADDNSPKLIGSAQPGTTIEVYANATCSGAPVASGTAAELAAPGIAVTVGDNSVTEFSVTATDAVPQISPCSEPLAYVEASDLEPPVPPLLEATDPASPATSANPRIVGTAEAGSTVSIFSGPGCGGSPVASGGAGELAAPGIAVPVGEGVTATFSAIATDAAANASACSAPISYTHRIATVPDDGGAGGGAVGSDPPVPAFAPPMPSSGCTVPKLTGMKRRKAKRVLLGAGCTLRAVKRKPAKGKRRGPFVVRSSAPRAGAWAGNGKVRLILAPKPRRARR